MGLFGKRKGVFGVPMAGDAPPNAGTPSSSPLAAAIAPSTAPPSFQGRRSFLDKLGLVADAFGNNHTNAEQLAMRDQSEYQQFQAQQRQFAPQQIGDSLVRLNPQTGQYESLYDAPKTQAPSDFERRLLASGVQPGTPEWQKANAAAVLNVTDPFSTVPLPSGGTYIGPRSGLPNALGGNGMRAPATPVGKLTPLGGGATPQGARTFPVR